ncbi:MAG: hypothetical protein K1X64_03880 [Myxococcaceae bacterium]|nr:hypothetical protein [Myxococcaceae bacterium]
MAPLLVPNDGSKLVVPDRGVKPREIDRQRLFPAIVPIGYLDQTSVAMPRMPLLDGLEVVICEDLNGIAGYVRTIDLETMKLTTREAHRLALENLMTAAEKDQIPMSLRQPSEDLKLFFFIGWLGANCLLLPGLRETAQRALGATGEICAMIPHRETLVLFEDGDRARRSRVQKLVTEAEKDGRKPITGRLLRVLSSPPGHWYATAPPAEFLKEA